MRLLHCVRPPMWNNLENNRGVALILTLAIVLIIFIMAGAFMKMAVNELKTAVVETDSTKAFYLAQAGLNRALYDLKIDLTNDTTNPSWADGDINGVSCGPNTSDFFTVPYASTSLGGGSYTASLKNVTGQNDEIYVKSRGNFNGRIRTLQVYIRGVNLSPWANAIFAGEGASGSAIGGNVYIHGSVHVLGSGLSSTDSAMDFSGTSSIGNNYTGMPATLSTRVEPCPTVSFGGETVQSLGSEVRVKNGRVDLSGTATAGRSNTTGNGTKETIDGAYVDVGPYDGDNSPGTYYDGFGGNMGPSNVYSDNGYSNIYDLGGSTSFPDLNDAYSGYATYIDYLSANALHVSEDNIGMINQSTSDFSYSGANGSISWNRTTKTLTVNGIIFLDDGSDGDTDSELSLGSKTCNIEYAGRASFYVSGNIEVHGDLLASTSGGVFPTTNALGFMTSEDIELATGGGDSQLNMIGAFYAEDEIISGKQNEIAGTFVSNHFDMGSQVPKLYQVPSLATNLPPGMIGGETIYKMVTSNWREEQ